VHIAVIISIIVLLTRCISIRVHISLSILVLFYYLIFSILEVYNIVIFQVNSCFIILVWTVYLISGLSKINILYVTGVMISIFLYGPRYLSASLEGPVGPP
jgi:hypothetical protein